MCMLGDFLTSDVGCSSSGFRNWAANNEAKFTGGNITDLEQARDTVTLSDHYSEEPDGGPYFTIPKKEFIRLLDTWYELCRKKPNEIIISYGNERFNFETKE